MSYNVQPANGYYLLEPVELEQTAGSFQLSDDAKEKSEIGRIIGIGGPIAHESGNGEVTAEYDIRDLVAYKPYTAHTHKFEGKEYRWVSFSDVLGKLTEIN